MKSSDLKNDLINKIVDACTKHIEQTKKGLTDQSVFSYAIYCSSGCRNMGVALCTRKGLQLRNSKVSDTNEPTWYGEVNSAEWTMSTSIMIYFLKWTSSLISCMRFFMTRNLTTLI